MRLVESYVEEWQQPEGKEGVFAMIEKVARICYASFNTTGESSREFVERVLINHDHARPLEFGSVYLRVPDCEDTAKAIHIFLHDEAAWSKVVYGDDGYWYVSTNYRSIMKHATTLMEVFENYWCDPIASKHEVRPCYHFVLSRGIADEFRTHVGLSSMMQSTRYCNYSKDKFNNEVSYVVPEWYKDDTCTTAKRDGFVSILQNNEADYLEMLDSGHSPQEARDVLGLAVRTELVLCGFDEMWINFFYRRCDPAAHPDARYLAKKLYAMYNK